MNISTQLGALSSAFSLAAFVGLPNFRPISHLIRLYCHELRQPVRTQKANRATHTCWTAPDRTKTSFVRTNISLFHRFFCSIHGYCTVL